MKSYKRQPGLVDEDTTPLNSESYSPESELAGLSSPGNLHAYDRTGQDTLLDRTPGRENGPTQAIEQEKPSLTLTQETEGYAKQNQWSRLFRVSVIFIACWLLYTTFVSLIDAWKTSLWLAIPLIIISIIFLITLIVLVLRERRAINLIDQRQKTHQQIRLYVADGSIIAIHETLTPILTNIKTHYPEEFQQFDEARNDRHTVQEYLSLLDSVVLSTLDRDVDYAIKKASLSVASLVAISPHPALDAIIVMIRANMLIRKIGHIYGLEPTGLSSLYLFRHTILSAISAAGIETLGSVALEEIGSGVTEKAAKILTEGLVSASRMYRLGKLTKKIIRPVPQLR